MHFQRAKDLRVSGSRPEYGVVLLVLLTLPGIPSVKGFRVSGLWGLALDFSGFADRLQELGGLFRRRA